MLTAILYKVTDLELIDTFLKGLWLWRGATNYSSRVSIWAPDPDDVSTCNHARAGCHPPIYQATSWEMCTTSFLPSFQASYRQQFTQVCWFNSKTARAGLGHMYIMIPGSQGLDPVKLNISLNADSDGLNVVDISWLQAIKCINHL